ncbi:uncharacterized protein LOC114324809 isoform X2 [Diabrotica virgifera virgifera]|uniref:Uncharacterized protein LOC114324809 isoform X2 n=1 Tax=Diabrotica virgifera virgifera TaxID=50390 RepID=A0A6P7EYY0_DIAVI|nr:uncharacterized protein LOC114324809 isoform X2 [Diabrotica virgifera virgifera]
MAVPYLLKINEKLNLHPALQEKSANHSLSNLAIGLDELPVPILAPIVKNKVQNIAEGSEEKSEFPSKYVYRVFYPIQPKQQLGDTMKRGRKKKKVEEVKQDTAKVLKPAPRTRSGRVVKFPKHIVKDFKKVEIVDKKNSNICEEDEIPTSDFAQFKEAPPNTNMSVLDIHQRPRKIASQYRCPKCRKAYMGKMKMLQHIKKYPDHGPLPQTDNSNVNFEVWNYLVDITQRCSVAQRGIKFCEELTNLLHNVLLLTSALFKKVEENKNFVEVDKVLGNAIGLNPGCYTFNDSELYKDVTVLKLITTTDFFKPIDQPKNITKENTVKPESVPFIVNNETISNVIDSSSKNTKEVFRRKQVNTKKKVPSVEAVSKVSEKIITIGSSVEIVNQHIQSNNTIGNSNITLDEHNRNQATLPENVTRSLEYAYFTDSNELRKSPSYCIPSVQSKDNSSLNHKDHTTHIEPELLSDSSLLHLSNIRNTVDELMLTTVDPGGTLLDNSTSSDEVINVDQFVNERFKKITEPDLELNLDLPSLDLFQFHNM